MHHYIPSLIFCFFTITVPYAAHAQIEPWREQTVKTLEIFKPIKINDWRAGMQFLLSKPKSLDANTVMDGYYYAGDFDEQKGAPSKKGFQVLAMELVFKVLTLSNIEERTLGNGKVKTYLSFELQGSERLLEYEIDATMADLAEDSDYYIPNLCSYDDLTMFKKRLMGATLYLRHRKQTATDQENDKQGIILYNRNFVTAQLTDIEPHGQGQYKVYCQSAEGDLLQRVISLGGTNQKSGTDPANFDRYFLLDNPKYHFTGKQPHWENILLGKIIGGMPESDVRLAFGDPIKIKTSASGSLEKWYYDAKILRLANGKLSVSK